MQEEALITLENALENALAPLDSFSALLHGSELHDLAVVNTALMSDVRARLKEVATCVQKGCARPLCVRDYNGVLLPVPCLDLEKCDKK